MCRALVAVLLLQLHAVLLTILIQPCITSYICWILKRLETLRNGSPVTRWKNTVMSQLASGEIAKFNGNKLPKAANMMKLRYDCELEKSAFAHAATCSNSNSDQGLSSVKRNIQMVPQSTATYRVDAMSEAIKTWWKQIRLQTQAIGMAVTFKIHHVNLPIRFFTMMAWATTSKLGCGVARCTGDFLVVCHYQPGGNVVDAQVYTPGDPCSKCPTGTFCVSPLCSIV